MMPTTITISFDFELGWGYLENGGWKPREQAGVYRKARSVIPSTLDLLRDLEIPTTWAAVGAMFYENARDIPLAHLPEGYREAVATFLATAEPESWQALDLVDCLARHKDFLEIASHTLTHPYAQGEGMSANAYVNDVRIGVERVEEVFGTEVSSHIFTRDQADFRHALAQWRPMHMRLNPAFFNPPGSAMRRRLRGAARIFRSPPGSRCYLGARGESYQSGSIYFNWADADFAFAKRLLLLKDTRTVLAGMGRQEGCFHIWLHPYNLCESDDVRTAFERFVKALAVAQKQGDCVVQTMSQRGVIDLDLWRMQESGEARGASG